MFAELINLTAGITLFLFVIHYICYIAQTLSINSNASANQQFDQNNSIATDKQYQKNAVKTTRSVAMQSEDAKYIKKYALIHIHRRLKSKKRRKS